MSTDNVIVNFNITCDKFFYKYWNSYTNSWSSWSAQIGQDTDNYAYFNNAQQTLSFTRFNEQQCFFTVHFRMFDFDWLGWFEGGPSHIFRSAYLAFYSPPKWMPYPKIKDEYMYYLICNGKSSYATNNFHSSISHGTTILQSHNFSLIQNGAAKGVPIYGTTNAIIWYTFQQSSTNEYTNPSGLDNPTQDDSYPWPW